MRKYSLVFSNSEFINDNTFSLKDFKSCLEDIDLSTMYCSVRISDVKLTIINLTKIDLQQHVLNSNRKQQIS